MRPTDRGRGRGFPQEERPTDRGRRGQPTVDNSRMTLSYPQERRWLSASNGKGEVTGRGGCSSGPSQVAGCDVVSAPGHRHPSEHRGRRPERAGGYARIADGSLAAERTPARTARAVLVGKHYVHHPAMPPGMPASRPAGNHASKGAGKRAGRQDTRSA